MQDAGHKNRTRTGKRENRHVARGSPDEFINTPDTLRRSAKATGT